MAKTISLRDANQSFAKCVREAEGGEEFIITRNGKPVARLVGAGGKRVLTAEQRKAYEELKAMADKGWHLGKIGPIDRDALYDDVIDGH